MIKMILRKLSLFAIFFSVALYAIMRIGSFVFTNFLDENFLLADYVFLGSMYNALAAVLVALLIESCRRGSPLVALYSSILFFKLPILLFGLYFVSELGDLQLLSTVTGILSFIPMILLFEKWPFKGSAQ